VSRDEALAHARTIVAATELPVAAHLELRFGLRGASRAESMRLVMVELALENDGLLFASDIW
jgi:2-methylisocitrate lyase-like PEP mutase family enzyme